MFEFSPAKLVEVSQPLEVVLGDEPSRPYLEAGNGRFQSRHVREVITIPVVLQSVGSREILLTIEAYGQLEDVEGAFLPVDQHNVGPVLGDDPSGHGNRPAGAGFVARNVDVCRCLTYTTVRKGTLVTGRLTPGLNSINSINSCILNPGTLFKEVSNY